MIETNKKVNKHLLKIGGGKRKLSTSYDDLLDKSDSNKAKVKGALQDWVLEMINEGTPPNEGDVSNMNAILVKRANMKTIKKKKR